MAECSTGAAVSPVAGGSKGQVPHRTLDKLIVKLLTRLYHAKLYTKVMENRTLELSPGDSQGNCVLYVMSRDQRVHDNHALLGAQAEATKNELPLIVAFIVNPANGHRRREHYEFMVEGLKETEKELKKFSIPFIIRTGKMSEEVKKLAAEIIPKTIYFDFSPLRGPRSAQKEIAKQVTSRVCVVDTHNIVPVWVASDKQEYAAHTLRRKVHKQLEAWLIEPEEIQKHTFTLAALPKSAVWKDIHSLVQTIQPSGIHHGFIPGETAAHKKLTVFIETGLPHYAERRNDPGKDGQSNMSPYLHFGQISSLRIALSIIQISPDLPLLFRQAKMPSYEEIPTLQDSIDAYLEELIVRKELSDNFCFYQSDYDNINGASEWAKKTLQKHANDPRLQLYTKIQLDAAQTHDELWNAAQIQLISTGKIHGYMRMYWAKKILEWSDSADEAIKTAIYLNDTYHLDGSDPNGYVGVMWSIAGIHDRPWFDRDIFGMIRYMSSNGAKTKFDTQKYIEMWAK